MFKDKLDLVPLKPGCYLMKDINGTIIYVGKAKVLQRRLRSYFTGRVTGKTKKLVSEIASFDYIVTNKEVEAFVLEANLIKEYDPKYNILLKDDKSYPYIELTNETYPRLVVKREININKKNKRLFGPYPNVYAARRIVNLLNRIYPLRKCDKMPKKECLYYHIHECLGYCINKNVDQSGMIDEITSFLNGNDSFLRNKIKEKMMSSSEQMNYEAALELKKELDYVDYLMERQNVELNDGINRDIFNYYTENGYISIVGFFLRNGKLINSISHIAPIISSEKDELEYYIYEFYNSNITPKELIVPNILDTENLSELLGTKVINIQKGKKKNLFDLANKNAKINYENEIELIYRNEERSIEANNELKELLGLEKLRTIEAFDNSNLFGTFTVSGMVVFKDGKPSKKDYRKFKISFEKNDDYHIMKEVIYRRYFRLMKEKKEMPDLIVVDGGINQINACKEILNTLNLNIKVVGLVKNDKHSTNALLDGDTYMTKEISKNSNVFHLLTRIQDEVHRYTINYHRDIRSKGSISSVLDNIPGIGETRKKELIKKFGSVKKMKEASTEELSKIIPENIAVTLKDFLSEFK